MSCAPGFEELCMAHDVCRSRLPVDIAGVGISNKIRAQVLRKWVRLGLVRVEAGVYDASELCRAYAEYVECLRGGGSIVECYRSAFARAPGASNTSQSSKT